MFILIDLESDIPIYSQIENQITIGIARGDLSYGELMPSVRKLGADLGVNFHTVNKAYKNLVNKGYLVTDRGSGTRVAKEIRDFSPEEKSELKNNLSLNLAGLKIRGYGEGEIREILEDIYKELR